jgi:hypothetical protein
MAQGLKGLRRLIIKIHMEVLQYGKLFLGKLDPERIGRRTVYPIGVQTSDGTQYKVCVNKATHQLPIEEIVKQPKIASRLSEFGEGG